ncbi:phospho-N-acetylmuramoyl-pentapeptide-transferase [Companilactobacillus sp. RD055328]|uniref:phospho-N-acetylmuramoyl-pentapeptide- transferase n=1 Tax=Companilactobacillus sp. RD055328 TaxID=2916634 RepID=UPI001FC805F9|nr:phospho-N-acetylmuramoyl-pentapeptide-transferase [Companilactobacillus sp. RD055328]GKQ42851.1 phospho-N-acetylmuramoyl-pentapeptide-transferase [Companilactobacillus sp. RD055328]
MLADILIPLLSSFSITVMVLPLFIGYLRMHEEGQQIREEGPKWHLKKSGTPTMGGLIFIIGILITNIWVGLVKGLFSLPLIIVSAVIVLFGILGFWDDFIKVSMKRNLGLRAWQKLSGQILVGLIFMFAYNHEGFSTNLYIPFIGNTNSLIIFTLFAIFWLVGFSNAVNLTDGLDGLVSGLGIISYGTYALMAMSQDRMDIALVCWSVVGGLVAFIFYNHKPAKIFMGDVGSLALGGGLAAIALILQRPWSLLLIGLVYVIETASVMLQVGSFKLFHRRIFKMTPIHHHFEMLGWSEWKIDIVFWIFGMICSAIYLLNYL